MIAETAATGIERPSAYRWVSVGLFVLLGVSSFMVQLALGVMLPTMSSDLGLSPAQQGVLSSAAFWANMVIAIPVGWLASRFGPRLLTAVMMVVATLCIFAQAWAPAFVVLVVARLLFGLTIVVREPARALLCLQWFPRQQIVMVSSVSNLLFGIVVGGGLAATPVILGYVDGDWRAVFKIFGLYFLVLTLLWLILGREGPNRESGQQPLSLRDLSVVKRALGYRDLWITGLGFFGYMIPYSAFLSFFPTLMASTRGMSVESSGLILAIGIFTGGVAGMAFGYIALDFDKGKVLMRFLGLVVVGTYVGMTLTGSMPALAALSFLNGVGSGFFPILYTVPFLLPGIRAREVAVASAVMTMAMSAGGVLGPLLAGFIEEGTGSLRMGLIICSFPSVTLSVAGLTLRVRSSLASPPAA